MAFLPQAMIIFRRQAVHHNAANLAGDARILSDHSPAFNHLFHVIRP